MSSRPLAAAHSSGVDGRVEHLVLAALVALALTLGAVAGAGFVSAVPPHQTSGNQATWAGTTEAAAAIVFLTQVQNEQEFTEATQ